MHSHPKRCERLTWQLTLRAAESWICADLCTQLLLKNWCVCRCNHYDVLNQLPPACMGAAKVHCTLEHESLITLMPKGFPPCFWSFRVKVKRWYSLTRANTPSMVANLQQCCTISWSRVINIAQAKGKSQMSCNVWWTTTVS